jgi:hypothetical protein
VADEPIATPSTSRAPRPVPSSHAWAWFADAIHLWKRAPYTFSAMGIVVLVASVALDPVPIAGVFASNVLAPLLACGFYYGSLAADRNDRPRVAHLFAAFLAPLRAQAAIVAAGILVTLAESAVAWSLAGVNLFLPTPETSKLSVANIAMIYAVGAIASLPLTFIPMAVLFDGESPGRAFAVSMRAFVLNPRGMLGLGAYSYAFLMMGVATMGVGLVFALPWIAAATYAAWKDIFGLTR